MSDAKVIPMVHVEAMPMPAGYAPSAPAAGYGGAGQVSVPPGPYGNHINLQTVNPSAINIA